MCYFFTHAHLQLESSFLSILWYVRDDVINSNHKGMLK